ncbi:unnamed protein product [Acanthoscelides obtectus]|uniref:Tyr recombinase domain-containing protein n=1 Tax=Acanthoscelides obtectus TaxID=200917 RepID=A0A9P0Q711_ACAOB|nr:unnamed protein product [Acanthoscelides obtectus]CAK1652129.1 hypothetical protein AOBTE_LOCUS17704 [Acanthoscelides obtectus]
MEENFPGGGDFIRRAFKLKEYPESGIDTLLASLANNTLRQYTNCYKKWWDYSIKIQSSPYDYELKKLIEFFNGQMRPGSSYSTINYCRSALSLVLNINRKDQPIIKRYLKGVYKMNTPRAKYTSTCDPLIVLEFLAKWYPLEGLNIQKLTYKLVMLVSLLTAHRIQTISQIRISNIVWYADRAEVLITDKIKTSNPKMKQPILILPFFKEKPELCVATVLKLDIEKTKELRVPDTDFLLLTHKRPHHAATSQTISRWLKEVIKNAGIDVSLYTSYSVRHDSTSAANRAGVDISAIRSAAGWSEKSETFANFYNRSSVEDPTTFGVFYFLNESSRRIRMQDTSLSRPKEVT